MQTATVLLTATPGWYDKLIRGISRSPYSHASISLDGINFFTFNYHGFVIEHPYHMKKKYNNMCIHIQVSDDAYKKLENEIVAFQRDCEKYAYSVLGVILCFLRIPHKFENKYFCSQFVAEMLSGAGIADLRKSATLYFPNQLLKTMENRKLECQVNAF